MHRMSMTLGSLVVSWAIGISPADAERIKILDRCDPATFNTTPAGVLCDPHFDGGVTFDEFGELLSPTAFGHPAWRFNAPYVEIEPQEKVRVINRVQKTTRLRKSPSSLGADACRTSPCR